MSMVISNSAGLDGCSFKLPGICVRSMESPIYWESKLLTFNRGEEFNSTAPDGTDGLKWISRFGFVGINLMNEKTVCEGMNEAGLSFSCLSLKCSEYASSVPPEKKNIALAHLDLGMWILGNFASIDEVKNSINHVIVWGQSTQPLSEVLGLHFAIHDAQGNNLVIEFINGQAKLHNNPAGVLANDPSFEAQLHNLTNDYANAHIKGAGSGLDEQSSESRFMRIDKAVRSVLSEAQYPKNSDDASKAATHILNSDDKLKGSEIVYLNGKECYPTTLWATIKKLHEGKFCFRSYGDMALKEVDLTKIDFRPFTPHKVIQIQAAKPTFIDITQSLG
jgi:choloylglycine hydrolase